MNNTELLKKISKKSGAPEMESFAFFELLVKKISKVLKEDEIIKLNDIGFFKIVNKDQNKIIVFSPLEKFDGENSIFYLMNDSELASDPVDSFFSISLDKPEIPLNEQIDSEFFVPPAGYELRSFMESKADDLLLESKIIKAENIIEENIPAVKDEIEDKIVEAPEIKEAEGIKIENNEDYLENKFDLKDDFIESQFESSEDQEEELKIDPEIENKKVPSEDKLEKSLDESGKENKSEAESDDTFSNIELQKIKEDFFKNETSPEIKLEDDEYPAIENIEAKPRENINVQSDKFQKVTSLFSKIPDDSREVSDLNRESKKRIHKKPEKEEIDENGFSKVKFNRIKSIEEEAKSEAGSLGEYELIEDSILKDDPDLEKSLSGEINGKTHEQISSEEIKEAKEKIKNKKSNRKIPLVSVIFLILIAAVFLIYLFLQNNDQNNIAAEAENVTAFTPSDPKIIARNYDIPVSYPYKKGDDFLFNAIDPSVYSEENSTGKISLDAQNSVESDENEAVSKSSRLQNNFSQSQSDLENSEPIPAENYQEIKNYIYSDGKIYFIQVASWNSLARAERHNSNLLKKGYSSSIEKLISPRGKIYYIVRLGKFNSLQEAERYLKEN